MPNLAAGRRFDIRRHRHIHAQRRLAGRFRNETLQLALAKHRVAGTGGGEDSSRTRRSAPEVVQGDERGAKALGQGPASLRRTIDDHKR